MPYQIIKIVLFNVFLKKTSVVFVANENENAHKSAQPSQTWTNG